MADPYYARSVTQPKTKRQGLTNFVQMIINDLEAGESREALLRAVDLLDDINSRTDPYQLKQIE